MCVCVCVCGITFLISLACFEIGGCSFDLFCGLIFLSTFIVGIFFFSYHEKICIGFDIDTFMLVIFMWNQVS